MAIAFADQRAPHDSGALYALLSQLLMNESVELPSGRDFDWAIDWSEDWDRADLSDPVTDEYGRLVTLEGALS